MKPADMRQIVNILQSSNNTVAITGAGISTEAGIPDFRGKDGIYTKLGGEDKVMSLINIDAFRRDPRNFYDFYWKHFDFPPVEPGQAHKVLANMEVKKFIKGVVTQNIDGLHQKAGSKNVIPIHGNMDQYICTACRELHSRDYAVTFRPTVPVCSKCKSILKPNVVFFGENIVNYYGAEEIIKNARCLLVIGTTLAVYPLAGFVESFNSFTQDLVIINRGPTHMDHAALMKVEVEEKDSLGEIMESIFKGLLTD